MSVVSAHAKPLTFVFEDDGLVPNNPMPFLVYKGAIDVANSHPEKTIEPFDSSAEPGVVAFHSIPGFRHYNPIGSVHGGYAATLLDSAMGLAVHSMLPAGTGYTTLEFKISFVRGMTKDTGPVRSEGRILNVGRRAATAEARITDSKGRLLAHATTTCLVFELPTNTPKGM